MTKSRHVPTLIFVAAATVLSACAGKGPAPVVPERNVPMARLSNCIHVRSGTEIHCVDGNAVKSIVGVPVPGGPHRLVVSYATCGVQGGCLDYFGSFVLNTVAGAGYTIEGQLDLKTNVAQLTAVDSKTGAVTAGPFPAERNAMGEDPKAHFNCKPLPQD